MKESGLKCNIEKYFFGKTEMEYLGLLITREGAKPINKKVEVIKNITSTTYQKQIHKYIGLLNYYLNMWARRPHTLSPLTKIK